MGKFSRTGKSWTAKEKNRLISAYSNAGRTYDEISKLDTFKGKRTIKAIRRKAEKMILGLE